MSLAALAFAGGLLAGTAPVLLEGLREIDLNDYAVGFTVAARTSPYSSADGSWSLYPYLTAVEDPTLTTSPILLRDGTIGLRRVLDSGFEFGVLGHVETLGFGTDVGPELIRVDPPAWTLEVGPTIGWRGLPIQPDLSALKGVIGGHSGLTTQLSLSVPFDLDRGFLVPYVAAVHQDEDFVAYYYDVPPDFSGPAYAPDAAINLRAGLRLGFRISEFWIVSASAWIEELDDVITASPIVDDDRIVGASLGLAYNRSIFRKGNAEALVLADDRDFELRLGVVFAGVDSDLRRQLIGDAAAGSLDLEDDLGVDDRAAIYRADGRIRLGRHHRVEIGYSDLDRTASVLLGRDVELGDVTFRAGERVTARYRSQQARAAYGYSFVRDDQKELGALLGVMAPGLEATVVGEAGERVDRAVARSPAPSIGAYARVALQGDFSAYARVETAYVEFDRYEGRIIDFQASADWDPAPWLGLSLGYAINHTRLEGFDEGFAGTARQRYSGVYAGLRLAF